MPLKTNYRGAMAGQASCSHMHLVGYYGNRILEQMFGLIQLILHPNGKVINTLPNERSDQSSSKLDFCIIKLLGVLQDNSKMGNAMGALLMGSLKPKSVTLVWFHYVIQILY